MTGPAAIAVDWLAAGQLLVVRIATILDDSRSLPGRECEGNEFLHCGHSKFYAAAIG